MVCVAVAELAADKVTVQRSPLGPLAADPADPAEPPDPAEPR
jgi:hypothetical protein